MNVSNYAATSMTIVPHLLTKDTPHYQFYCPLVIIISSSGSNRNYLGYAAYAGDGVNVYYGSSYGGPFSGIPSGARTYGAITWYTD